LRRVARTGCCDLRHLQPAGADPPLELQEDWPQEELDAMSRIWNERFSSLTLREVRARLLAVMAEEKAVFDTLVDRALEMGRQALAGQDPEDELCLDGAANILDVPEFADPGKIRALVRAIEEKGGSAVARQCLCTDRVGSSSAGSCRCRSSAAEPRDRAYRREGRSSACSGSSARRAWLRADHPDRGLRRRQLS
jgi:hypothetical protein